jgi:hypothetical protein
MLRLQAIKDLPEEINKHKEKFFDKPPQER